MLYPGCSPSSSAATAARSDGLSCLFSVLYRPLLVLCASNIAAVASYYTIEAHPRLHAL